MSTGINHLPTGILHIHSISLEAGLVGMDQRHHWERGGDALGWHCGGSGPFKVLVSEEAAVALDGLGSCSADLPDAQHHFCSPGVRLPKRGGNVQPRTQGSKSQQAVFHFLFVFRKPPAPSSGTDASTVHKRNAKWRLPNLKSLLSRASVQVPNMGRHATWVHVLSTVTSRSRV